jgi:hypothetical protein
MNAQPDGQTNEDWEKKDEVCSKSLIIPVENVAICKVPVAAWPQFRLGWRPRFD